MDALRKAVVLLLKAHHGRLCMKRETFVCLSEEGGEGVLVEEARAEVVRLGGVIGEVEALIAVLEEGGV